LLDFLCELYYDARIHEHQVHRLLFAEKAISLQVNSESPSCIPSLVVNLYCS